MNDPYNGLLVICLLGLFAISFVIGQIGKQLRAIKAGSDSRELQERRTLFITRLVAFLSLIALLASSGLRLLVTFEQITPLSVLGLLLFGSLAILAVWFPVAIAVHKIDREKSRQDELFAAFVAWTAFLISAALLLTAFPCRYTQYLGGFQLKGYPVSGGTYVVSGNLPTSTIDGQVRGTLRVQLFDKSSGTILAEDEQSFSEATPGRHFVSLEPVHLRLMGKVPELEGGAANNIRAEVSFEGTGRIFSDNRTSASAFGPGGGSVSYETRQIIFSGALAKGDLRILDKPWVCKVASLTWALPWYWELLVLVVGVATIGWTLATTLLKRP